MNGDDPKRQEIKNDEQILSLFSSDKVDYCSGDHKSDQPDYKINKF